MNIIILFFSAIFLGIIGYLMPTPLANLFILIFIMSLMLNIETNFKGLEKNEYIKKIKNEIFVFKFVTGFIYIGILFRMLYNN
jgi:Na+-transporting methylmalonyl-CoA/oxaloacetate decarboxylase gamma subunit